MTLHPAISDQVGRTPGSRPESMRDDAGHGWAWTSRIPSRRALVAALRSPAIVLRFVAGVGLGALVLGGGLDLTVLASS